jgi:hypothetical protein
VWCTLLQLINVVSIVLNPFTLLSRFCSITGTPLNAFPTHLLTLQSLSLTLILIFIVIYIYAGIAFLAYRDEFKLDGDNEGQSVSLSVINQRKIGN